MHTIPLHGIFGFMMRTAMLGLFFLSSAFTYGADPIGEESDPVVSIEIENGSLSDLVHVVISQTGYTFFIAANLTNVNGVSMAGSDIPVSRVFAELQSKHGICAWRSVRSDIVSLESCGKPIEGRGFELFPPKEPEDRSTPKGA